MVIQIEEDKTKPVPGPGPTKPPQMNTEQRNKAVITMLTDKIKNNEVETNVAKSLYTKHLVMQRACETHLNKLTEEQNKNHSDLAEEKKRQKQEQIKRK